MDFNFGWWITVAFFALPIAFNSLAIMLLAAYRAPIETEAQPFPATYQPMKILTARQTGAAAPVEHAAAA